MKTAHLSRYNNDISKQIDIYGFFWFVVDGPEPKPCFENKEGYLLQAMTNKMVKMNVPREAVIAIID